jgi:hypothetical protein
MGAHDSTGDPGPPPDAPIPLNCLAYVCSSHHFLRERFRAEEPKVFPDRRSAEAQL